MDFVPHELVYATAAQRDREARAIASAGRTRETPRTLRAALAARLVCLAAAIDREVVRALACRHLGPAPRG
jgi:plasmid maintenance system killer protein